MKKNKVVWVLIGVLIGALIITGGSLMLHQIFGKTEPVTSLESLTLHLSGMRVTEEYEILPSEGGYTLSRYEMVYGEGTAKRRLTDSAACSSEEVLALLNDCQVMKWDGFDGPHPKGVLDGTMFRFDACVNDGKSIQAQGSQNFPKHFHDFEQGLYALLNAK